MEPKLCYLVFLLQTVTPCHIPQLASYLYQPPTLTSPKENGIVSRKEVNFDWIAPSKLDMYGLLNFLYDLSYKLEVRKRGDVNNPIMEYKTKNLFILLPEKKCPEGHYQARITSIGIFGSGQWSAVRKFEIVDAKPMDERPAEPPHLSTNSSKAGHAKVPSKKPEGPFFVPKTTAKPEILVLQTGDKVELGHLVVQWTQVLGASSYILRLEEDVSGKCKDFQLINRFCENCETNRIGMHTAKVAGIVKGKFDDWGPEIKFEIVDHLKPPNIVQPLDHSRTDRTVEFEWSKIDGVEKYELLITNSEQSIRVETPYTFYNMWQFTSDLPELHQVKVAAIDSFRASDWSSEISFTVKDYPRGFQTSSQRIPSFHKFNFQPVSTPWMLEMCNLHLGGLCDRSIVNRQKMEPIEKSTLAAPVNRGQSYGHVWAYGNTFFTALSHAISTLDSHHLVVRNFTIRELIRNQNMYISDDMHLQTYFQRYGTDQGLNPPTDIEIVCAANLLETTIWIFDFERNPNCWVDYQPRITRHREAIYLTRRQRTYSILYTWA